MLSLLVSQYLMQLDGTAFYEVLTSLGSWEPALQMELISHCKQAPILINYSFRENK